MKIKIRGLKLFFSVLIIFLFSCLTNYKEYIIWEQRVEKDIDGLEIYLTQKEDKLFFFSPRGFYVKSVFYLFNLKGDILEKYFYPPFLDCLVKIVPDENAIYIVDKDTCYKFTKGEEIWRFKSQGVITNFLVEKEAVYLSSLENHLYKINSATGELLWKYKTKLGEKFYSFCKGNNVIYVTTQDKIFAFSLSGKEKWRRKGFLFPSVTVRNQTIFVISVKGKVSALNERGDLLWECILEKGLRSYPVNWRSWGGRSEEAGEFYFKGEKIYVSGEKDLWAIDCKRGKIEWHFASKRSSNLAPVILNDDIYFVADETITVVDLTGKIKWEYKAKSAFCTYPIVDKEKYIYIGNLDGNLYIFSSNGILEKKINIKKIFPGGAIVIKEGILCVLSSNKLIALNVDAIHKDILNKTKK